MDVDTSNHCCNSLRLFQLRSADQSRGTSFGVFALVVMLTDRCFRGDRRPFCKVTTQPCDDELLEIVRRHAP